MAGVTLEQSLRDYQSSTNTNLSDVVGSKTFTNDLTKFKKAVLRANADFHRHQGESIWPTLARILAPFQTLGTVATSALSLTPFAPASLILGATLHLVNVTRQMIEAYSTIGNILEQIADIMDRLKIHNEAQVMRAELRDYVQQMMGVIVEVLGLASKCIGDQKGKVRAKEFFQRALLGKKAPVEEKMMVLRGLAEKEVPLVLALANSGIEGIKTSMSQERLQIRMEKILQLELWTAMKQHHENIKGSTRDGMSTDWIIDEPKVQRWMEVQQPNTKSAMIWIKGERGTGKSYAASHLIRTLLKENRSITTYFYVQGHEKRQDLASSIFTCIALQLVEKSKGFREIANEAFVDPDVDWNPETIWKKLFVSFLRKDRRWRTFIVIDGLDAADPAEQDLLLSKLKSLQESTFKGRYLFHVAIFARPSLSLNHDIWSTKNSIFQVPEEKIRSNVAKFIETKLSALARFSSLTTEDRDLKVNQLSTEIRADFALAGLVVTQAQVYRNSERDLMGFLDRPISPDIRHHVRDILSQVDSAIYHKRNWISTLQWIACACRMLTVNEVLFLRHVDLNSDALSLPERLSSKDLKSENQSILIFTSQASSSQSNLSLVELKSGMFRDYLVQEDNDVLRDPNDPYSIQKSKAHATIAGDIMEYAADHVIDHLRTVRNGGILGPGENMQLANHIRKLLNHPAFIQRWYDSVSKQRRMDIIKLLLHDDEILERINNWCPNLSLSAHNLYAPFAQLCNRAWMQGSDMDTQFCLLFLQNYDSLELPIDKRANNKPIEISELKGEQILHLAEKASEENSEMAQSSDWQLRIGDTLMKANHLKDARAQYERVEKASNNYMAKYRLALLFAEEGNVEKAVQKAEEALSCAPEANSMDQSNIYASLHGWQSGRGKTSDALDAARQAHELDPKNLEKLEMYFLALGRAKKWKLILTLCEKFNSSESTSTDLTRLLLGWEEGHDILTRAVSANKEYRGLAEDIFKSLVDDAKQEGDSMGAVWEEYQRGLFYYRLAKSENEHLRIWEQLPSHVDSHTTETEMYAQQLQCRALSGAYYRLAVNSNSKQDIKHWVSKLESLAGVPSGTSTPESNMENRVQAAVVLGRWRRKNEGVKSRELKLLFQSRICQGIQILEDDDPLNDSDGYAILAQSLLWSGNTNDALRVFAAGMLPLATSLQWTKEPKNARDRSIRVTIKAMKLPFKCHGKLRCEPDKWLAFYVCRDCPDKSFCVTCLTGGSARACDESHHMLEVFLRGREIGKPMAKFEGSVLEVDKKWLGNLKKSWDITDETKAARSLSDPPIISRRRQTMRSTVG
ncbi:hypothetical protein N7541_003529 [Penicillium brevicompactum]|uniref:Fungal STAND N-terminal Goodbye domain-containing protein n=1 Tax=Penicillium brevicompactum TaxID=5074 RepID=A0A9W9RNC7_PENBR|nr:hypothetical protein N7541_003529 [Penicillium brevicompactum]